MAIQVLLGIANRFKTKGIRQGAEQLVSAIADREGWTLDELADRTIPDAGFARQTDENNEPIGDDACLELDYGPRKFSVRLDDELEPVITREDGKTVKSPPVPAKDDDEEKAKAAKKAFSEAKKVVKDVVKRQAERFYEAVCTQRSWQFDDWSRYLNQHPIVSRLCGRLIWAAFEKPADGEDSDGRLLGCFRPLADGTLTNETDDEAQFDANCVVRLAHTANLPAELQAAWTQHLKDYDVDPLFVQFGRETFKLPEAARNETDLADFAGHQITTFKLRGKATKLGFIRGDAEDGGCFFVYRKPFPSLRVQAVLEFTGNCLPEEDRPAALRTLSFTTMRSGQEGESSWSPSKMPLGKVPPVLLSECYNDIRQIAAEGTGFDPKWESKQYW